MDYDKNYKIEELSKDLFAIDTAKGAAMYLVIGSEKALLIDTGIANKHGPLEVVKTLTDKPIELALTHAHIDHMYFAKEFSKVYLHENDIEEWNKGSLKRMFSYGCLMFGVLPKTYDIKMVTSIDEDTVLDIGGNTLKVILAPGHTPGSVIFVDDLHKILFMGDCIGNGGASAFMWLPGCLNISEYQINLKNLIEKLEPYKDYTFLGGHRAINFSEIKYPIETPLNYNMVVEIHELCGKMLAKEIEPQKQVLPTVWQYVYKNTGMIVRKKTIK